MAQQDFSLLLSALPDAPASDTKAAAAPSAQGGDKVADFVGSYLPLAQRVAEKTGVAPEALLGQWGLETGWGKSVVPGTNNLGNIKDFSGKGPKAVDNLTKTTDAYRAYETVDDFGDDFAGLLSRRYRTALNSGQNTQKYFAELKRLGYAEAPNYVDAGVKAAKMVSNVMGTSAAGQSSFSNARTLATDRSMGEALADNLLGAASGAVTGVKLLADTFGADNRVSQALDDTTKALTNNQSQYRKDQRQERQFSIKNAEASGSTWNEIVANVGGFLEAPVETTLNALGTSAPTLLMAAIPGLGQAQAARFILQGAAGAAQGVGAAKSGIYDSVRDELIKTGKYTADEAAKIAAGAQAYDSENAGNIAINGLLGLVAGTSGIESVAGRLAGRKAGQETSRGIAGRAGMGVVKESPVEGAQGGFERYTSNVALNNEGIAVDPMQGVFGQAAGEAIASAPGGAAFGALDRGTTPPPAPNPLQPVVDQAQKPGSVLSRAVVSTGVADQPIMPPGGPAAGSGAAVDPISARVSAVETDLRSNATLEKIRGLTPDASSEFLYALNIAKNPGSRADLREQAITQVEQVLETAKSGTAFTMVPPEKKEPSTALTVPGQQGGDLATKQGGPLAPNGMGGFFDPNTVDVDAVRVDNMIGGPRAIEGPRARIGTNVSTEPQNIDTSEQRVAPVDTSVQANPVADSFAPETQQTVAEPTQTTPPTPAAPEIPKVSPEAGGTYAGNANLPAATRKRAATLRQLADQGFETVERRGNDFFLKNSGTGQELKLDGMADSQLARNQIKQAIDAKANTAAASPLNDRAEPTAAQIAAGNYKKSDVIELNGMKIKIENPKDSIRRGTSPDGVQWETKMAHHYGEFQGTEGADGDKLDVFVGPRPDSSKVFVIDQVNEDGSFDEHKVMMGFTSQEAARAGYLANYEQGWTGLGAITEMPVADFKAWAKSRAAKKPLAKLPSKAAPRSRPESPAPTGQFATLEEAKGYLSQQRRSNGNVSGLPLQMADGSYGIAIKGTPQYAQAERQRDERDGVNKEVAGKAQGTMFTVRDGGKQRQLRKVSKGALPKKSSRQRPGDPRPISQDEATAIEQMAAVLGKTVVFYETADGAGRLADGFVNPGEPGVIYVATETTINPVAIFGHEFYHTLRETNPQAWNAIAQVVRKRVKDAKGFRADYYGADAANAKGDEALNEEQGGELEELISDLGGNLMLDSGFWGDVFAQIQKDNGKNAKGIIARLAASIQQMVARVVAAINQGGFAANDYVNDIEAIRAEFAQALAGYIQKAGISKSAMDTEIKKSVIRVSAEQKALEEFAAVDAQYRGTDQWMKAPNGRPTQLNERQWIQVRTPSFKAWFGDWEAFAAKQGGVWNDEKGEVSKAVDDNGEPLVVYHGTSKGGFSEFKTPGGTGRGDLGIFTTPNLEMAKTYNKRGSTKEIQFADMEPDAIEGGDTPGYYASFINIRKPYETDFEGALWNGERPEQWVVVNEDGETQYTKTGNQFFDSIEKAQDFASSLDGPAEVEPAPDHWETTDDAVREARSNRNDGAIIRSVIDDGGGYSRYFNEPSDVFVALDPNQLKSATQNTGEFGKRTDDMRFSRDRATSDVDPSGYNEFMATPDDLAQADAYEAANGIRPYTSAGQLQVPVELPNIRKSVKREGKYGEHPVLGIPVNANGTVSLYFPTTNDDARRIVRERTLKGAFGADRVYLTNESGVGNVMAKMGNIDQEVDGANVLVQINPDLLHIDTEYEDGRKDFFIPIAEGSAFKEKMAMVRLFTQNAPRDKPLTKETKLTDLARRITDSIKEYLGLDRGGRQKRLRQAKDLLRAEHNVTTLLSVNGKLEKTNLGGYGINNYDGKDVMSMGLGLASAQRINEQKLSTCPQSAICESLCLGETSGQNLLYGGEGQFKSGPRMSQYLKTEAMVQHPEEFAIVLHAEIANFERKAKRDDYQATVRLNVTSDFRPQTFEAIINAFPGVMFYDYTKLPSKTISKNHHLTYSSTGASQIVNGKVVINPESNWTKMVDRLNAGDNVAMAFTDRNSMPKFVVDGKTGQRFQVWDGDNYDARFLDPKRKDGIGMIVGLTNKDRTTKPEMAAEKHNGFFVDYNPERDGDTVVIPDQERLKAEQPKTIKLARFSRDRDAKDAAYNQRISALKDLISCLKK